jgi:hypothetical protein
MAGPFYFAWVDETDNEWSETFAREDQEVFAFTISQQEGEAAQLTIDVVNPRTGLLNGTRKVWAWLAYQDGETIVPLFFGRLIGIPQDMQGDVVQLAFIARALDFEATKAALAETLKVAPFWDPMFITEEAKLNPDSVLEARSALWHVDRINHAVSISDIIQGEEGVLDIAGNHFYDALKVTYQAPPASRCIVEAEAAWTQQASGQVDISGMFPSFDTYTGQGLADDWPKPGDSIGGNWVVVSTDFGLADDITNIWGIQSPGFRTLDGNTGVFNIMSFNPSMVIGFDSNRSYSEKLTFTLVADVQAMLLEPADQGTLNISLSAAADAPVDPGGATPIGNAGARRFYQTDRGQAALRYLIALARAKLLARARAVEVQAEMPFSIGIQVNCRSSVTLTDVRLPGGVVTGKVKAYQIVMDGDSGSASVHVTLGCTVGNAGSPTPSDGVDSYVDDYVSTGYQWKEGMDIEAIEGEVFFADYSDIVLADDGINFNSLRAADVVRAVNIYFDAEAQEDQVRDLFLPYLPDTKMLMDVINAAFTEVEIDLLPIDSSKFQTPLAITLTTLSVPKTIDLSAASLP